MQLSHLSPELLSEQQLSFLRLLTLRLQGIHSGLELVVTSVELLYLPVGGVGLLDEGTMGCTVEPLLKDTPEIRTPLYEGHFVCESQKCFPHINLLRHLSIQNTSLNHCLPPPPPHSLSLPCGSQSTICGGEFRQLHPFQKLLSIVIKLCRVPHSGCSLSTQVWCKPLWVCIMNLINDTCTCIIVKTCHQCKLIRAMLSPSSHLSLPPPPPHSSFSSYLPYPIFLSLLPPPPISTLPSPSPSSHLAPSTP